VTDPNRRQADRVPVETSVQIYGRRGFVHGTICDLSRTGLRMRVRAEDLGFAPTSDLREAAEGVAKSLGERFALDLNHDHLGPLLQRGVELTRVGLPADAGEYVELCCQFDHELAHPEASFLETDLPPARKLVAACVPPEHMPETGDGVVTCDPQAERPVEIERPQAEAPPVPQRPRQRYRALVSGTARDTPSSFFCHTDLITVIGVRVRIPRADYGEHVTAAMRRLVKRYGRTMDLRILAETDEVWGGDAQINGVELPADQPDVMLVTLGFKSPLRLSELRTLGLVRTAA